MFRFRPGLDRAASLIGSGGSAFLSLIFPPRCPLCRSSLPETGISGLCPDCARAIRWISPPLCPLCGRPYPDGGDSHRCQACLQEPPAFDRARSLTVYEGPVVTAVQRFKYHKDLLLTDTLAGMMGRYPWEEESFDLLIPVPLHRRRLRERGFNQAMLLCRRCGKFPGRQVSPWVLQRVRPTAPQIHLRPSERAKNVRGAFQVRHPREVEGKEIMLVDDVYTTGATVNECARVLKRAGAARVLVFTLARVVPA